MLRRIKSQMSTRAFEEKKNYILKLFLLVQNNSSYLCLYFIHEP